MKRKRLSEGEVRFRTGRKDRERIEWLLKHHPSEFSTVSSLLRSLIATEVDRLQSLNRHIKGQ